ncbi:MAG: M23 family metallopeptidase [Bacillota bacterium]
MIGRIFRRNKHSKKYQVVDWPQAGPLSYRGWPEEKPRKSYRKTVLRFTAAVAILAVLLALREIPGPFGGRVQESLRYVLTTEWNLQPVFQKAVQIGLQMVNENYPLYGDVRPESREALGRNTPAEELLIPLSGKVVRGFGWSPDPVDGLERFHSGIDIQASPSTPVKAARSGKVARTGNDPSVGYFILLDHGEDTYTLYAGLAPVKVAPGETVRAGQVIGEVGTAGDVQGGGLHFELREKSKLVDPLTRLKVSND